MENRINVPFCITDQTLSTLKWLAVGFMLCDHLSRFYVGFDYPTLKALGRVAMPLFLFVFACNLARPGFLASAKIHRLLQRLLLFGLISQIPFILMAFGTLKSGWLPLNIFFSFLVLALALEQITRGNGVIACLVFLLVGLLVDYGWSGITLGLGFWLYFKGKPGLALLLTVSGFAMLCWLNQNLWALLAIPVILLVAGGRAPACPRWKWFFYGFYPAHMLVIVAGRWLGWGL